MQLDWRLLSVTPIAWWPLPLPNNRGWFSAAGVLDTEKVEVLGITLDRLPADHIARALVLSTLCSELTPYGSPLERRQALADEAVAIAESSGDDALILRVLNNLFAPLLVPSLHEQSLTRTADSLVRRTGGRSGVAPLCRLVARVCCFPGQ